VEVETVIARDIAPVRAFFARDPPHQLPDDEECELAVEPKPPRVVIVLLLCDGLVVVDERLVSGTEPDAVADVAVRVNTGRGQTGLFALLLVRVQLER